LSPTSRSTLSTLALLDVKIVVAFQSISFSSEIVTVDKAEIKSEILMLNVVFLSSSPEPSGSLSKSTSVCSPSRMAKRRIGRRRAGMPRRTGSMMATDPARTITIRRKEEPARRGRRITAKEEERRDGEKWESSEVANYFENRWKVGVLIVRG